MGKRSGVLNHEADVLKLTIEELDREIARCVTRVKISPSAKMTKLFQKRIHWLRGIRSRHFE